MAKNTVIGLPSNSHGACQTINCRRSERNHRGRSMNKGRKGAVCVDMISDLVPPAAQPACYDRAMGQPDPTHSPVGGIHRRWLFFLSSPPRRAGAKGWQRLVAGNSAPWDEHESTTSSRHHRADLGSPVTAGRSRVLIAARRGWRSRRYHPSPRHSHCTARQAFVDRPEHAMRCTAYNIRCCSSTVYAPCS